MDDKTKKILKNTGFFAAAVGITAAKAVKWSAEQVWEHKEEIAGGIVGGAKGMYHMGQNIYGATIRDTGFEKRLEKLKEQSAEYREICSRLCDKLSKKDMLLDSLGISASVIHGYYHIDYIPEEVEKAYKAAYPIKSQTDNLRDIIEDADDTELAGLISGIKCKLFEMRYVDFLNNGHLPDGHEAVLAESATNPGWDIAILDNNGIAVNELQMKATDSVDYIKTALERYPDIDIVTTEEVYNSVVMHEFADSVINSGISNEELTSVVTETLESDSVDMDWGLPVIPMLLIGYSVYKKESLSSFEKGTEFGDRYIQSYISYIAGGAVAVITNTWWLGLIASMGTKVFCKYGRVKFNKAKSLDRTISLNEKILKKMRKKLKYASS